MNSGQMPIYIYIYIRVLLINQSHTRSPIRRAIFYAYPFLTPRNSHRITERCIDDIPFTPSKTDTKNDYKANFFKKKKKKNRMFNGTFAKNIDHLVLLFSRYIYQIYSIKLKRKKRKKEKEKR